jgi:hypothetical protein
MCSISSALPACIVAGIATGISTPLANADAVEPRPAPKQDSLVVRVDGGFHWGDAAIGAAAGFGAAMTLVGGVALVGRGDRVVIPDRRNDMTTRRRHP